MNVLSDSALYINNKTYTVLDKIGEGSSSTVYLCLCADTNSKCIVKEYDPKFIEHKKDLLGHVVSTDNNSYRKGMDHFIEGAVRQREIRNNYPNSNVDIKECIEDNNTAYIIMPFYSGVSYDGYKEESLNSILSHIRAILKTVDEYHKLGLLHLDIKPSNVFILDEVKDLVLLFDFDSVVSKEELSNSIIRLSFTKDWAAPELLNPYYMSAISEKTDYFSVGEILFYMIFNRHSEPSERRSFSDYDYDECVNDLLDNVDDVVKGIIKRILNKSICGDARYRYSTSKDFLHDIDEAIKYNSQKALSNLLDSIRDRNQKKVSSNIYDNGDLREVEKILIGQLLGDDMDLFLSKLDYPENDKVILANDWKSIIQHSIYDSGKYNDLPNEDKVCYDTIMAEFYIIEQHIALVRTYVDMAWSNKDFLHNGTLLLLLIFLKFICITQEKENNKELHDWIDAFISWNDRFGDIDNLSESDRNTLATLWYFLSMFEVSSEIKIPVLPLIEDKSQGDILEYYKKEFCKWKDFMEDDSDDSSDTDITEGIESIRQSIEQINDENVIIQQLFQLADVYLYNNVDEAKYILEKLDEKISYVYTDENSIPKARVCELWAEYYLLVNDLSKADYFYENAEKAFIDQRDEVNLIKCLVSDIDGNFSSSRYERALCKCQVLAEYICDNPQYNYFESTVLLNLAKIYIKTGNLAKAENVLKKTLDRLSDDELHFNELSLSFGMKKMNWDCINKFWVKSELRSMCTEKSDK